MDRLPGDRFGTQDWIDTKLAAVKDERACIQLPLHIREAAMKLMALCQEADIPMYSAFSLVEGVEIIGDIGDEPQNCHINFMLSRGTASGEAAYMQGMVMNPSFLAHIPRQKI